MIGVTFSGNDDDWTLSKTAWWLDEAPTMSTVMSWMDSGILWIGFCFVVILCSALSIITSSRWIFENLESTAVQVYHPHGNCLLRHAVSAVRNDDHGCLSGSDRRFRVDQSEISLFVQPKNNLVATRRGCEKLCRNSEVDLGTKGELAKRGWWYPRIWIK